tara:strand:+ start:224 stop:772 length:549 start_codon:yes stop_codon:yes gene_type:complete
MDFLPTGYTPKDNESPSKYLKLKNGDNLLRILSKPLIGYVGWRDKHPHRAKTITELKGEFDNTPKEFWAVVCYSYDMQSICIWEITQKTILKAITNLATDEAWGNPLGYDLKITRTGEDLQTEYQVSPYPHKKVPQEVKLKWAESHINLDALLTGDNPFSDNDKPKETAKVDVLDSSNDLPF